MRPRDLLATEVRRDAWAIIACIVLLVAAAAWFTWEAKSRRDECASRVCPVGQRPVLWEGNCLCFVKAVP